MEGDEEETPNSSGLSHFFISRWHLTSNFAEPQQEGKPPQGGAGSRLPRWGDYVLAGFKPATEGAWSGKGGAARVGGAGAGLREAKPSARKT